MKITCHTLSHLFAIALLILTWLTLTVGLGTLIVNTAHGHDQAEIRLQAKATVAHSGITAVPKRLAPSPALQNARSWHITGRVKELGKVQGLVSRDMSGQAESGHLTVYLNEQGQVVVRNQGLTKDEQVTITGATPVKAMERFHLEVSIGPEGGLAVWQDGKVLGRSEAYYPLNGNNLPLTVGGSCMNCDAAGEGVNGQIAGVLMVRLSSREILRLEVMGVS